MLDTKRCSLDSILKSKRHYFKDSMIAAMNFLESEPGELKSRDADYEIASYEEDDFRIIFYPHKTKTTGNVHIRIRVQGNKTKRCRYIMTKLANLSRDITFSWNHQSLDELSRWEKEFGIQSIYSLEAKQ